MINLPNVTLVCIDSNGLRGINALCACMNKVNFKQVFLFTEQSLEFEGIRVFDKYSITSKERYSYFVFKNLYHYIETEFMMICQWDGFIINPDAWTDEFLQYDYIGAPWWYNDGMNVGNGGFSIRSKRLMEMIKSLPQPIKTHPEDECIGRTYRPHLEQLGMTYAPEEVAERFSWECNTKHPRYKGAFGFHGTQIKSFIPNIKL